MYKIFLTSLLCSCVYTSFAQTKISFKDMATGTVTAIPDAEIKNKKFQINPVPSLLTIIVNNPKAFTVKAKDGANPDGIGENTKKGTAVFSFIPNSAVESGNFKQGTETTEANTMKIKITVVSPGYYTINSDEKSGLRFFATGYLEKEGQIDISLRAFGTPTTSGTYKFTISGSNTTTEGNVAVATGVAVTVSTLQLAQTSGACTKFTLEGKAVQGRALSSENKLTVSVNASVAGYYHVSTKEANGYFYSGSGMIARTGVSDIVLSGKGIPRTPGNDDVKLSVGAAECSVKSAVEKMAPDLFEYLVPTGVTELEFTDPDKPSDKYTISLTTPSGDDDEEKDEDALLGGVSVYENAVYKAYGEENLVLTPYGLLMNTKTVEKDPFIYGGTNFVHIFLDEMGNSLITGIPQGMPEVQYVVHVIYREVANGKAVSYGIKTTRASFSGVSRIENNRGDQLTGAARNRLREYTLVIRTADSDIDFEVYRFENGKQVGQRMHYTIPMTNSFTANISVGLLNTWLKNPSYSLETDPANTVNQVAKLAEGNNRGYVTVFATLYTSPITLIKYYVNRRQIKDGKKSVSKVKNPVTNGQLHSKNYLYMRPIWERIYPTVGVGISDKVFQNLFFGVNWEFARGGSFFAGGHYGKVNIFNAPADFEFQKTNLTQDEFNLYSNKAWKVGWTIGASIDFAIIGNLFK